MIADQSAQELPPNPIPRAVGRVRPAGGDSDGTEEPRSPAERAAQAKALQVSIAGQVETLREAEQWQRYLDFVGAFHTYSLNNVLLILSQCPHTSQVVGFRKW